MSALSPMTQHLNSVRGFYNWHCFCSSPNRFSETIFNFQLIVFMYVNLIAYFAIFINRFQPRKLRHCKMKSTFMWVVLGGVLLLFGGTVDAWGGLFNRFSPEMLANMGYGNHGGGLHQFLQVGVEYQFLIKCTIEV